MITFAVAAGSISLIGMVASAYFLARNRAVYRYRMAMIDHDYAAYKALPSYERMLYAVWIWPIKIFWAKP